MILPFAVDLDRVLQAGEEEFVEFLIDSAKALIDEAARKRKWGVVPWDGVPPEGGIQSKRQLLSNAAKKRGLDRLWSVMDSAGAAPGSEAAQVIAAAHSTLLNAGKKAITEFLDRHAPRTVRAGPRGPLPATDPGPRRGPEPTTDPAQLGHLPLRPMRRPHHRRARHVRPCPIRADGLRGRLGP